MFILPSWFSLSAVDGYSLLFAVSKLLLVISSSFFGMSMAGVPPFLFVLTVCNSFVLYFFRRCFPCLNGAPGDEDGVEEEGEGVKFALCELFCLRLKRTFLVPIMRLVSFERVG